MKAALIDRYGSNDLVKVVDIAVPVMGPMDLCIQVQAAAALPVVARTAWPALVEIGRLGANQRVVIHAGSGGVGSVASQLARHLGATVFTTVGQRNVELVKRLGADVPIDYRGARFEDVAKDCDVVLDSAGGDTLVRCFECVKPGGVVVSIGSTPSAAFARSWGLNPFIVLAISVMSRKATAAARGHNARYEYFFVRADGEQLREITRLVESGVIKPLVDKVFPLEQVRDALAYS